MMCFLEQADNSQTPTVSPIVSPAFPDCGDVHPYGPFQWHN